MSRAEDEQREREIRSRAVELRDARDREYEQYRQRDKQLDSAEDEVRRAQWDFNEQLQDLGTRVVALLKQGDGDSGDAIEKAVTVIEQNRQSGEAVINEKLRYIDDAREQLAQSHRECERAFERGEEDNRKRARGNNG
ncbi:hypothetical protein OZX72_09110 [Bifidobacterium sp. ESL0769]|uniref:hypothetical protein n=1 Tax=Bifidobacterium sp. ESL0769 TaxID=2983229 RepID=UPI0023F9869F|nr:hypothetical protein [Bifidobacterium sp. ESL0769]WEV67375.1 hypothetical protein OZX72_09110 [Bifidobacterium sp. ESL0769]